MIEYNQEYENRIREIISSNPKNFMKVLNSKGLKKTSVDNSYLIDYIKACTPMLDDGFYTMKTRLYWTLNHISDFPVCGNDRHGEHRMVRVNVRKLEEGYPKYCDSKCQHEAPSYFESTKAGVMTKYGVDNVFRLESVKSDIASRKDEIQAKRDATYHKHYGDTPGRNLVKSLETRRQKYGSAWNVEAIQKTKVEKYGDPNWNNSSKAYNTKRDLGILNSSVQEDIIYDVMKNIIPDLIRQYKSDKYPFSCDFYDPDTDTYFEYNGSWTHGGHPFDANSSDDISILAKWKAKNTEYYNNAITTWTERDPHKRNTAKLNNIRLIEFWNYTDVEKYFGFDFSIAEIMKKRINEIRNSILIDVERSKSAALKLYDLYGESSFKAFQGYDFPYTQLKESSVRYEMSRLMSEQTKDQTPSKTIRSFHPSMYSAHKRNMLSPRAYWDEFKKTENFDNGEWEDFFVNRYVYANTKAADEFRKTGIMLPKTILDGFSITHRATCVSYLKPMLAKRLVSTYLKDVSEVFCPFNGFSGIMLGTAYGCGKRFIGRDLNSTQIGESLAMVRYLSGLGYAADVDLGVADVFENRGEYESMFCCPPYSDFEQWNFLEDGTCVDRDLTCDEWIDVCLANYRCGRYLFVTDESSTVRYAKYAVERITNSSHFGNNAELVLLIEP